jgi:hypothetical protein
MSLYYLNSVNVFVISLERIFGPKRDEVTGELRKLRNEELNDLYCSQNVFRVIKSTGMRGAGHVASMGRAELHTGFWWGNLRKRDHLEDPGLDGRMILKCILKNRLLGHQLD